MSSTRRWLANLDAEAELAAVARGRSRPTPNRATLAAMAGAGTLLRALAGEGDRVWTVAPVAPERMLDVPGLPRVVFESGPFEEKSWVGKQEPWMETPSARRVPAESAPGVVMRVADRAWGLGVAARLRLALPGATPVGSTAELAAALAKLGDRPWIVKAAYSAAGRDRLRPGQDAARFFARHGHGVLEPWVKRQADFGAVGEVGEGGQVVLCGVHGLLVDAAGRFRGIVLRVGCSGEAPGLAPDEAELLTAALHHAGRALAAEGYRGPFGLDAFRYLDSAGREAFHPWVELNPRWSFGRVARALVDRLTPVHGWPEGSVVTLEMDHEPPRGAVVVLRPGDGGAGAWVRRDEALE
ncbi:MAG: hypothetical protein SF066_04790 [Thermoanaerobaculia bacterium]|nr:hypothetical protein [Thermoanaerobaculia bacterium]